MSVHVRIAALGRKYFALTQYACDIVKRLRMVVTNDKPFDMVVRRG